MNTITNADLARRATEARAEGNLRASDALETAALALAAADLDAVRGALYETQANAISIEDMGTRVLADCNLLDGDLCDSGEEPAGPDRAAAEEARRALEVVHILDGRVL